jgi:3-hydroxyacyl-[acyl-carrier-protein] dehydratase
MDTVHSTTKKGYFYFDPNDPIYKDHFPGQPVVPGSLIIHAFISEISRYTRGAATQSITNFRFKRFVLPGCYAYRIEPKSAGRLACFLYDEDKAVVTGTL